MDPDTTSWGLIARAKAGENESRQRFAQRYDRLTRAYLGSRWATTPLLAELDDAVQEVFVECFRQGGVLEKAAMGRGRGFRAFFYGVVRNVALRHEKRRRTQKEQQASTSFRFDARPAQGPGFSALIDRTWAQDVLHRAVAHMAEQARGAGPEAVRRVEILELRFEKGLPIRDIAKEWQVDVMALHRQYARARQEFRQALEAVLREGRELDDDALQREIEELGRLLRG